MGPVTEALLPALLSALYADCTWCRTRPALVVTAARRRACCWASKPMSLVSVYGTVLWPQNKRPASTLMGRPASERSTRTSVGREEKGCGRKTPAVPGKHVRSAVKEQVTWATKQGHSCVLYEAAESWAGLPLHL